MVNMTNELTWRKIGKYDYWNGEKGYHEIATNSDRASLPGQGRSWFGALSQLQSAIILSLLFRAEFSAHFDFL